ncbi:carbohydrate deacetylase [Solidesulfovibrio alcoholivorans]|uniref:carbohydrate deacetylase n=1 Tax=Solidesulfovibrio alcoholivorans TaxID=81406 RepID=UPI0005C1939B|nr:carbohydrate deacetylase [Solidesulfovibrio alcoholivorans]
MRRLFVNADDFGLTEGISRGIAAAMASGVVGGTTAMICPVGAPERIGRYGREFAGRIGLHLQLTGGTPPCLTPRAVPSLVGADGSFPRKKIDVTDVSPDEVRREWRAQLARFRETGLEPSHLDSHHHIHKRPEVFPVFLELARELGVPARALSADMRRAMDAAGVPHADDCLTRFYGEDLSEANLLSLVDEAFAAQGGAGVLEVMAHPGYDDAALRAISTYAAGRAQELRVLTSPELARQLAARGIAVVGPSQAVRFPGHLNAGKSPRLSATS